MLCLFNSPERVILEVTCLEFGDTIRESEQSSDWWIELVALSVRWMTILVRSI